MLEHVVIFFNLNYSRNVRFIYTDDTFPFRLIIDRKQDAVLGIVHK